MTTVTAPSRILVTGASGYLATGIVQALVQRGYNVVGTVRSIEKGEFLKRSFGDAFEYVIVEDMEKAGAYDDAVKKNIDGVVHAASVVEQTNLPAAKFINPAVQATVGILESARLPSVKRIIITSSVSAVYEFLPEPKHFTESDWNNQAVAAIEKDGDKANPIDKYAASKVLAERAAWDYVKKHDVSYQIATVIPCLIVGPIFTQVTELSELNLSMETFYENTLVKLDTPWSPNFIDVRDAALAHVLALEVDEAAGKRLLMAAVHRYWQEIRDELRQAGVPNIPEGSPYSYKGQTPHITYEGEKAAKLLGLTYRPFVETAKDAVESIRSKFSDAV